MKLQPTRWTIGNAAAEFGIDPKTLSARIKSGGITPGDDGRFSTADICNAVFGDYDGARTRLTTEQADIAAIKKRELLREWIPISLVAKVWDQVIVDLRQKIVWSSKLNDTEKAEILKDLQALPIDEYFTTAIASIEADADGGAEAS